MNLSDFPPSLTTQSNDETIHWQLQKHLLAELSGTDPETSEIIIVKFDTANPALSTAEDNQCNSEVCFLPVYQSEHGAQAVPSGSVYVRLDPDMSVESLSEDFLKYGLKITKTSLIPYVGWLQSVDSDLAAALSAIEMLITMPGVIVLEPQLLMDKETR